MLRGGATPDVDEWIHAKAPPSTGDVGQTAFGSVIVRTSSPNDDGWLLRIPWGDTLAAAIVVRETKVVDSAFIMDVFSISPKYCASLPKTYRASTMAFVPVLTHFGYITTPLTTDDVFDSSIITTIHSEQEHYSHPGKLSTTQ